MTPDGKSMTAGCSAARALMDFALSKGCRRDLLLERSGIDPADLWDEENRIPIEKYVALMNAGRELSGDAAFALHFGESDAGIESTIACMMGIFSPSAAGAIAQMSEGGADGDRYRLTRDGDNLWIADTWNADFREGKESSFARVVCAARRLFPGCELVKAVHFTHAEPPDRAEYDRIFRMPVVFNSEQNGLLIDAAWLTQNAAAASQQAFQIARSRVDNANCTRSRVEAVVADRLHTSAVNIDAVARTLAIGRYTLFRKLKAEGVTFRQVVDELRHKMAVQYLRDKKLPVNETAYLLGFSDPAAFSRAFKRWTGQRPSHAATASSTSATG